MYGKNSSKKSPEKKEGKKESKKESSKGFKNMSSKATDAEMKRITSKR